MTFFEQGTPRTTAAPARRGTRRALWAVLLVLVSVAGVYLLAERTGLVPPFVEPPPEPPAAEVVALIDRVAPTEAGRTLLYRANPRFASAAEVAAACEYGAGGEQGVEGEPTPALPATAEGGFAPLGCYTRDGEGARVLVYVPADARLADTAVTTMAHEYLHAVYDRMSNDERAEVDALMASEITRVPADDGIHQQIEGSTHGETATLGTERFAYLGTQFAPDGGFAPRLEEIYAEWFTDRQALVRVHLAAEAALDALIADYETAASELLATEQQNANDRAQYNADLASYERRVAAFNDELARYNALDPAERGNWTVTITSPDGTRTTEPWGESLSRRGPALDDERARLGATSAAIDEADTAASARRAMVEAQHADLEALLQQAAPSAAPAPPTG